MIESDITYKNAVVLLNMGGPNSLQEVSIFLKNMFNDFNILRIKSNFVRSMVGSVIVNKRVSKSMEIYTKIGGASPMTPLTFNLTKKLSQMAPSTFFTYAMRYVAPRADMVLEEIKNKNIENIVFFSMYPQYSFTTTLSSFKDAADSLKSMDFMPNVKIIDRYFDNKIYINAVCNSIIESIKDKNPNEYILILSAHSIPASLISLGDPYKDECEKSKELILEELKNRNYIFKDCILSYQSKLGPIKWLQPYTKESIQKCKDDNVIIYPLSFTIDNSETKYELDLQYRNMKNGMDDKDYIVCECLNSNDDFVNLILSLSQ